MVAPALSINGLSKRFGGLEALGDVDLEVAHGEILGLIGPNGSGKSTLVNCVSGVLKPAQGQIFFNGHDVTRWSRVRRARAGLGRTFQNLRLFSDLSVAENVEAGTFAARGRI